jgi:hypothetical protein
MSDKPVPVFSSYGKATNDFFTKGFPAAHKLEIATKAENGLTFSNSAEKKARKDGAEYILGKMETKYKLDAYGLDFTGTVDTDNVIKADVSVNKLGLAGLKLFVKPQTGKANEVNAGFEFQNANVSLASSLLFKGDGDALANFALVGSNGAFSGGIESNYYLKKGKTNGGFDNVKGLLGYKTSSLEVLFFAKGQWETKEESLSLPKVSQKVSFGASYEHKAGEATTLHSTLDYDTSKSGAEAVAVKFGGSHKLDADTTFQSKVDTEGKLGVHLAKQLHPNLKATFTTEFNLFALSGPEHKFALGVAYKA